MQNLAGMAEMVQAIHCSSLDCKFMTHLDQQVYPLH